MSYLIVAVVLHSLELFNLVPPASRAVTLLSKSQINRRCPGNIKRYHKRAWFIAVIAAFNESQSLTFTDTCMTVFDSYCISTSLNLLNVHEIVHILIY